MFRPSQALSTRTQSSLTKNILHHQLPLNSREAHKLLNILTASFRRHLDAEHGSVAAQLGGSSKSMNRHEMPPWSLSPNAASKADQHLAAVLNNPLFKEAPRLSHEPSPNPKAVFKEQLARGVMNLFLASEFLLKEKKRINNPLNLSSTIDGMKKSGSGLTVLKWLVSSGAAADLKFFENSPFVRIFMQFIVAEGLQEAAWTWIEMGLKRLTPDVITAFHSQTTKGRQLRAEITRPLNHLIQAEVRTNINLDAAYLAIGKASHYTKGISPRHLRSILGPSQMHVLHHTLNNRVHALLVDSTFDIFLDTLPGGLALHPEAPGHPYKYYMAYLLLRHPTRPSADAALKLMPHWHDGLVPSMPQASNYPPFKKTVINLYLETTMFLLEQKQYAEAELVMNFLRRAFSEELGEHREQNVRDAVADASSVELLDAMPLA